MSEVRRVKITRDMIRRTLAAEGVELVDGDAIRLVAPGLLQAVQGRMVPAVMPSWPCVLGVEDLDRVGLQLEVYDAEAKSVVGLQVVRDAKNYGLANREGDGS